MEKLTNGPTVSVRMTVEQHAIFLALAASDGMEPSEYVRHLIELRKEEKRLQWEALNQLFGAQQCAATNTKSYSAGHDI